MTTTTDTKPNPLAGAIPAELCARIKAHDIAAGRWLEPFMDWCETFVLLRGEHDEAEKSHPLGPSTASGNKCGRSVGSSGCGG